MELLQHHIIYIATSESQRQRTVRLEYLPKQIPWGLKGKIVRSITRMNHCKSEMAPGTKIATLTHSTVELYMNA